MTIIPKPDYYPRLALPRHNHTDADMTMLHCRACGWSSYPVLAKQAGSVFGAPFRCRGVCGALCGYITFNPAEWREAYERASVDVYQDRVARPT